MATIILWQSEFCGGLFALARKLRFLAGSGTISVNPSTKYIQKPSIGPSHTSWNITVDRVRLAFWIAQQRLQVPTEIKDNKTRMVTVMGHRQEIENAFGEALKWCLVAGNTGHSIESFSQIKATANNRDQWPEIQADLVGRALRLERIINPYLLNLVRDPRKSEGPARLDLIMPLEI